MNSGTAGIGRRAKLHRLFTQAGSSASHSEKSAQALRSPHPRSTLVRHARRLSGDERDHRQETLLFNQRDRDKGRAALSPKNQRTFKVRACQILPQVPCDLLSWEECHRDGVIDDRAILAYQSQFDGDILVAWVGNGVNHLLALTGVIVDWDCRVLQRLRLEYAHHCLQYRTNHVLVCRHCV